MERSNQVIIQLREADRYANAASPHFRRLAVILLDNVIELQLSRKAELAFLWDHTWTTGVRKYSRNAHPVKDKAAHVEGSV